MDVRMPDGTIVSNVPDGITQSELLSRYGKYSATQEAAPGQLNAETYKAAVAQRAAANPDRSLADVAQDAGIAALKGAISLPESMVGLADIPTGGRVGKLLEEIGYKPKESREILDTYLSEAQQAANRKVSEAEGFLPTIGAALQNPSTIASSIIESAPQMLGGAGVARGLMAAAPKLSAVAAGAIGEGLLGAGSAAEQTRGEAKDKLLTAAQALSAAGSGVGTAAFGAAGGRLANKLGLDDIDTLLASGTSRGASKSVGDFAKRAIGSGISEGVFEELPQSAQEQMWANYATDKPLMQGVAEAAGMGAITGFAMGVGGGGAGHLTGKLQEKRQAEIDKQTAAIKAVIDEQKAAAVAPEAVAQPEQVAQPEPVQDVNAPSQDREAMLKELEDQLTAIGEEPGLNKLSTPVAETQQPVAEAPAPVEEAPAPVEEGAPVEAAKPKAVEPVIPGAKTEEQYMQDVRNGMSSINAVREKRITQAQYEEYQALAEVARKELDKLQSKKATELSPAQQEAVQIAERMEALGEKHFSSGVRNAARNASVERNLPFYREKLADLESKRGATEKAFSETHSLKDLMKIESDRGLEKLEQYQKSAAPATRKAVERAGNVVQQVKDAINSAGYAVNDIGASSPQELQKLKNLHSSLEAGITQVLTQHSKLATGHKVSSQEALNKQINILQADINKTSQGLRRYAQLPPEIREQEEAITGAKRAAEKTAREAGSLWTALTGKLDQSEVRDIFSANPTFGQKRLQIKGGKKVTGAQVSDIVADGALDQFLPPDMRHDSPTFDEKDSTELIKQKIREQDYLPFDTKIEIEQIFGSVQEAEKLVDEFLTIEEQNLELQTAADEQREGEIATRAVEPEVEGRPAEPSKGEAREPEARPAPELELAAQTADELKAKQDEIDRLAKENARLEKEAAAKAKADAEREEFVLTGSKRPADEAAARGQKDIFEKAQGKVEANEIEVDGATHPRLNSNEQPIATSDNALRNFWKWFGASKVTDASGKPLVMYHGTNKTANGEAFTKFDTYGANYGLMGLGSYFTADPAVASEYSRKGKGESPTVYAVYLSIANPLDMDAKADVAQWLKAFPEAEAFHEGGDTNESWFRAAEDAIQDEGVPMYEGAEAMQEGLRSMGYDGITHVGGGRFKKASDVRHRVYIAFDNTQIKSATGNTGEYGLENGLLSHALGNIEELATEYNGEIVYGDDERGLISVHGPQTGELLYVPYVKDQMYRNDIEQFPAKSFGLKESEYQELVKAKQDLEAKAAEQHAKNPFLTIKPGVTGSAGVAGKVTAVAKNWAKILKLDGNIHIMTAEEALANKDKFTGPHRALGYIGTLNEPGVVKKVGPNDYVMIVRKSTSTGKMLEVIAHELGHIHQKQAYENASVETKNALIKEFNAWFRQARGGTAKELVESMRAKRVARSTQGDLSIPARTMKNQEYWFSFGEWYADQVSRWAMTNEKPVGVVEQFFAKLGAAIKKFFAQAKAAKFLPNETFAQYLEQVTTNVDFTPAETMKAEDQMPLFSKGAVEGAPPTNYRNYKGEELPPAQWDNLEDSKLDTFQYKIVDKQIDTKRVIENIKKAVGDIADKFNAYIKEELYHGRTAKGVHDFLQKELLPLVKDMKAANVTIDEFDEYLHNRHAPEYNEHINKVNPTKKELKDTGSGISTEAAENYMKNLSADRKATFEKLAAQVDSIVKNTQDILIASGIETTETIDAWRQQFPFYVPLNRKNLDYVNQGTGVGSGYGTKGSTSKRATGSLKDVIDIIENIAMQREKAIMKAEKARVGRALYGLAIQNPNPKFWLPINPDAIKNKDKLIEELIDLGLSPADAANIAKEPASATFNKKTGLVEYEVNPLLRNSDNVFPIRINGKDRFIIFNGSDPRAARMVQSLKNLDAEQMGIAMGTIGEVTRFMASVNTQYNPVFGAWNFLRDVQGAALNLTTTDIAGEESKVLKGVFPALKSIYSDLRAQRAGKEPQGEWQELFERYQKAGGATGYKEQFSRGNDAPGIVARELKKLDRGNVRQAADAVFNWLSDYNDAMENAVRLSAFKVALDKGLSEDKAASIAKNLTVNFNRKGAASPTLQALYAFFNASVQGTKRLAETLQGPAGRKIVAGGFTIGVIQAIALAMAGYDDDEPPQFLKDKNLILPMPDGDYLIVPMPMGFNIFPGIGRLTAEYILGQAGLITGAKGLGDKTLDVASLVLDSFNPLGSGSLLQIVSPTAFDPLAAIQSNKDAFGRPISKEDRATSPTPGFMRSREGATWLSKNIAELLNYVSSPAGTQYTKGKISPTADQLDYLAGQYTGGVGREVMKAGQYAAAVVKGETSELPSYRVPILGKAYGETTTPSAIASKFYMNVTELAQHENEIKQRMKNKEDTREYRSDHPETRFINRANYIENQIAALNKQKKALQEKDAPAERIKKIDEQKTALMKGLNDQIKKLQQ